MVKPYIVLGTYHPSRWKPHKVGRDLVKLTQEYGLVPLKDSVHGPQTWAPWCSEKLHAEVKRRTPRNPKGEDFHQDGDLDPGSRMDCAIVLWSSNTPTEIKVEGHTYRPNRREVILFRNLAGFHRRPPATRRIRWVFRQRVELPTHLELP